MSICRSSNCPRTGMLFAIASTALAFGPLAAFAHFDSISFSPVQQCGNFTVLFSGGKPPSSLPLTLTVVPFNSTPISIEIPDSDWNTSTVTGAAITFLPFPAGTVFVASLDDANGVGTGLVSDVITVDTSSDTSCLSPDAASAPSRYKIDSTLSQCEPFDVQFDTSIDAPPTIRAFIPKNISTPINQTASHDQPGHASYTMAIPQGQQAVLVFSDDTGFRQATSLLAIQGSSQNPTSCLPILVTTSSTGAALATQSSPSSSKSSLSR